MPSDPRALVRGCVQAILLLLAAVAIATYVGVALARMAHPYELEWFEGTSVDLVRRVFAGQPLYVAPSIDFVPHLYAPFYSPDATRTSFSARTFGDLNCDGVYSMFERLGTVDGSGEVSLAAGVYTIRPLE